MLENIKFQIALPSHTKAVEAEVICDQKLEWQGSNHVR